MRLVELALVRPVEPKVGELETIVETGMVELAGHVELRLEELARPVDSKLVEVNLMKTRLMGSKMLVGTKLAKNKVVLSKFEGTLEILMAHCIRLLDFATRSLRNGSALEQVMK